MMNCKIFRYAIFVSSEIFLNAQVQAFLFFNHVPVVIYEDFDNISKSLEIVGPTTFVNNISFQTLQFIAGDP